MGKRRRHKGSAVATEGQGTANVTDPEEAAKTAPHTFIINRGTVGKNVGSLIKEMRRVMEPYTASKLKVREKNSLKDFLSVAGVLNVTHMMLFSKTDHGTNIRILRTPRGPTLTFQVSQYTLARDVITSLRRPHMEQKLFLHHPLLVMNNFSGEGREIQLMATVFQNMFPSINVNKVKLSSIRRCVLFNYNSEERTIEFRHFAIKAVPVGMSKGVKKLIKAKIPNLNRYGDMSEFLLKEGDLSESEAELDGPHNEVVLAQDIGSRGNIKSSKSAIRLTEIGPRMTLKLVKIEEGVCDGPVLYHQYKHLTSEEQYAIELRREQKKIEKDKRKKLQSDNVLRKEAEKKRLKDLSLAGMKKKSESEKKEDDDEDDDDNVEDDYTKTKDNSDDDDVAYYTQEVGEAPDKDLGLSSGHGLKRKRNDRPRLPFKKKKMMDTSSKLGKTGFKGKHTTGDKKMEKYSKGKKFDKFSGRENFDKKGRKGDSFGRKDSSDKKGNFRSKKAGFQGKDFNKGRKAGRGGRGGGRGRGRR